jgi:hypothetical protein
MNECISCANNYYNIHGICVEECPEEFYKDKMTNICIECHPLCNKCTGPFMEDCQECSPSLFFYQ